MFFHSQAIFFYKKIFLLFDILENSDKYKRIAVAFNELLVEILLKI